MIVKFKIILCLSLPAILLIWASTAFAGNVTISSVTASPTTVDIYPLNLGTSTSTTITAAFSDSDIAKAANDFYATIKVRKPNNIDEIALVNFKKNGQLGDYYPYGTLSITGGPTNFTLSYTWNTYGTETAGQYDVYIYIFDGTLPAASNESLFTNNLDKIELTTNGIPNFPVNPPTVGIAAVTAPADTYIQNPGTDAGTITASFTDIEAGPASGYLVTIKAREPDGKAERTLVSGYSGTTTGEAGTLTVSSPSSTNYNISFSGWNPSDSGGYPNGYYDIRITVTDPDGLSGISDYSANSNMFAITTTGNVPADTTEPSVTAVSASPSSVLANSDTTVNLTATISDNASEAWSSTHFFKLRHQSGAIYGPFTGSITGSYTDTYVVSIAGLPAGWYDIYYEIKDADGNGAAADFDSYKERLYIYPSVTVSGVSVSAPTVDRQPDNSTSDSYPISTTISATLVSANSTSTVNDFYVTIKVRNPDNSTAQPLVSSKKNGEGITISGAYPNYTVQYIWTPASTDPEGLYDISISVFDSAKNTTTESGFTDNPDKVEIVADPTMPWPPYGLNSTPYVNAASAGNVCVGGGCIFATTVSLSAEFTDVDAEAASSYKASVSIRSPDDSTEYVLMTDQPTGSTTCNTTYTDSCALTITSLGSGRYRADLTWNPKDTFFDSTKYGYYDVKAVIKDSYLAGGESGYDMNANILSIISSDFPPPPTAAPAITSVYATPNSTQIETANTVTFKATFTDDDDPSTPSTVYTGSFKIRAPDNTVYTPSCTPAFTKVGTAMFSASCAWSPIPGTLAAGYYDIQFSLTDNAGTSADTSDDVTVINSYDSSTDELQLTAAANLAPNVPSASNMSQIRGAALTAIPVGGWTNESPTSVIFRVTNVTDQNAMDDLYLEVEVEPVVTAFDNNDGAVGSDAAGVSCTPGALVHYVTPTAVTLEVTCSGFLTNTSYHWQARVKDVSGGTSGWVSFGGNTDPNDADFSVDTTAPSVNPPTDPPGGGNGSTIQNITANFTNGPIDCATVTNTGIEATSTFYIKQGGATWVNATVFSCSDTQIVLDPTSDLTDSQSYTVYITTGVKDKAGNALGALYTWSFTARAYITAAGAATATVASPTSISVSMPYTNDANANNTYTVEYKLSASGTWSTWASNAAHIASPYTTTITGLTAGSTYDVRMTYNDVDGVTGTNPQTVTNINLPYNSTTFGAATATAVDNTTISVSIPYTDDANANNTYTVDYKLSTSGTWTNLVTNAAHIASPYTTTITGLTAGSTYDVRMTYNDTDGVTGTNPQTVTNIILPIWTTAAGAATATVASPTSISVSMPYTNDANANNTYTVEYKLSASGTWSTWASNAAHIASPYTTTITGLAAGSTYDVRMTYNDTDGVTGTNPQTVTNIILPNNTTIVGVASAAAGSATSINVSMPYTGDINNNNTYTVEYKLSASGTWSTWASNAAHIASPYTTTITGLTAGSTYDVRMTYNDVDGVTGTNPQTVANITLPYNSTTVGAATATAVDNTTISVSMPYTDDANANNTYTVDYKLSTSGTWTNLVTNAAHIASPYTTTITGLTAGSTYDVRMTYNDTDGVTGTNPQTLTNIILPIWTTAAGAATATVASPTSISVSMPYTNDANANNTYTVEYKLSASGTWSTWASNAAHIASPYTTTITGLTAGSTYDVRMTYNDTDGETGTNPQTVANITLPYNSTTVGAATATAVDNTTISVSMPYTDDANANNTYTVDYKLSTSGTWTNLVTNAAHIASPYT